MICLKEQMNLMNLRENSELWKAKITMKERKLKDWMLKSENKKGFLKKIIPTFKD